MNLIEPKGQERITAARICRANAHLHVGTGRLLTAGESRTQWLEMKNLLPRSKWLWMWRHGRREWDPRQSTTAEAKADK